MNGDNDNDATGRQSERLCSAGVQKFWTGINCPSCENGDGKEPCPDLWIQDNGDGFIYDGDVGHCDECGKHFSLLVDAYDQMYAYVDDEQNVSSQPPPEPKANGGWLRCRVGPLLNAGIFCRR